MRKFILMCASLCAVALLISANPARAQNVKWVSPNGDDSNSCIQTLPCATFAGAISKANVSQINCLTSGNFGPVTITGSITIDCGTGNIGTIVASSGIAIAIDTSSAATIVLRHLSLNGLGSGGGGIQTSGFPTGALVIEDCLIQGFGNGYGISFGPTSGRGLLQVSNTQVFNNESGGILISPEPGQIASMTLNRVELTDNGGAGLFLGAGSGVVAGTMRDSIVGANGVGIFANATQVFFTVEESSIVANASDGIQTNSAGANINVTASTISSNSTGVQPSSGNIISFGNNTLNGNATNGSFTSTTTLK